MASGSSMELKHIGRYEIQQRLGKGGMGSLYLARDPGLDRLVAIKLLKEDYLEEQEFRERFAREARALARLRHPNIVVVYDFGQHEGRPFMAMEYIDGETLSRRLARTPPLKLPLGLAIVEDLCAGLASAHDAGIVHRDIKPDNIMIDRQGVLKLLDFGIARSAHAESTHQMTQPGMIMGTYNYMSPEQLLGEMVDKRSDIFAVGAVLYQVIAREQAFPGAFGAVYHRVLTAGPVPLEERVPGVDANLVRIVRRALERDPQDRYQSANDMKQELARARQRIGERAGGAEGSHETIVLPRTQSSRRQKDSEAKRGLVTEQLRLSQEAFARGDFDIALQYGERAAFVDPDNETALELINKSRVAIEAKSVHALLGEANRLLAKNQIRDALAKAEEAAAGVPDLFEAEDLRKQVQAVIDQIVETREREDRINSSLERARGSFDRGEYETALRVVYEVLALDPDRAPARELEQQAKAQLQAKREHERARASALDRISAARALADKRQYDDALAALHEITPPSDSVRSAVADALATVERQQLQARTDAAVAEAREAAAEGHFTHAVSIIDAIPLDNRTPDAHQVRADALESLNHQRQLQKKRQQLEQALASAEALISAGDATQAHERLEDASELGLDDHRIDVLSRRLDELVARVDEQRRKQASDREAADLVAKAHQLFTAGNLHEAVTVLEDRGSAHPDVTDALAELRGKLTQIEERSRKERERREEEARERERKRLAGERQRQEDDAQERERKRIAAERERQEAEARERERQRIAAERERQETEARERERQRIAAERERQETEARERERQRIAAERERQETETRERERERIAAEDLLAQTQLRQREERPTATVVRPAKTPVQEAKQASAATQGGLRNKALVAAAALVVLAIGAWLAMSMNDEPGGRDSAQVVATDQPTPAPGQQPGNPAVAPPPPTEQQPPPPTQNPPADAQPPTPQAPPDNKANPQVRRQEEIATARTAIQGAMDKGDLDLSERLLVDAQRRLGADNFRAQTEALAQRRAARKDEDVRASVRDLLEKSRQERDNQAAIGLLKSALQLAPGDAAVQAELRRRNEALTAEARQREAEERERQAERQAEDQRQRQAKERDEGIKNAQAAIERALARGDLDGADTLVQDAERRYGANLFGTQRQQLSLKREQAVAADAERIRTQIRAVLAQFAQAYGAKDEKGLAAVWPSFPQASFRSTFRSFETLSWVFGNCDIDVAGATATATCPVTLRRVDVRGRETSETGRRRFTLRNAGAWRIEDMRVQ